MGRLLKALLIVLALVVAAAGVSAGIAALSKTPSSSSGSGALSTKTTITTTTSSSSSDPSSSDSSVPTTTTTSGSDDSSSSSTSGSSTSSSSEPTSEPTSEPSGDEPSVEDYVLPTSTMNASCQYYGVDSNQWFAAGGYVPVSYSINNEDNPKVDFVNNSDAYVRCNHAVSIVNNYRYFCIDFAKYTNLTDSNIPLSTPMIIRFEITTNKSFGNISLHGCYIDFRIPTVVFGVTTRDIVFDLENDAVCTCSPITGSQTVSDAVSINFGGQSYTPAQWESLLSNNNVDLSLGECLMLSDIYSIILQPKVEAFFYENGIYLTEDIT